MRPTRELREFFAAYTHDMPAVRFVTLTAAYQRYTIECESAQRHALLDGLTEPEPTPQQFAAGLDNLNDDAVNRLYFGVRREAARAAR